MSAFRTHPSINDIVNLRGGVMSRVPVHRYDEDGCQIEAVGWFDPEQSVSIPEANPMTADRFAAARRRGDAARFVRETLYRTKAGRWVHQSASHIGPRGKWVDDPADATPSLPGPAVQHRYLDEAEALAWLSANARTEDAERWLQEASEERGPGRPEIGQPIQVRLGDLLAAVDEWAGARSCSRAEAVRRLVHIGLAHSTT
ncbi:hypothetical protein [Streptomyces cinereoruber]|uniref:hypothetical protein n=1 Tax=Streptomyces cinereoruber TaxID=67260 RepID=UPI0036431B1E